MDDHHHVAVALGKQEGFVQKDSDVRNGEVVSCLGDHWNINLCVVKSLVISYAGPRRRLILGTVLTRTKPYY